MIRITGTGEFKKTSNFLNRLLHHDIYADLDRYGQMGVDALSRATPEESGLAAHSWSYKLMKSHKHPGIEWHNTDTIKGGTPVVILLQYGHATGTGGYVAGRDFINPALSSIFDQIAEDVWKKVNQA